MEYKNEKLEEFYQFLKGKKVAIIGMGVSNLPLLKFLYDRDASLTIFDKKELKEEARKLVEQYSIKAFTGEDYLKNLHGFDIVFRSPSFRPDTPELLEEEKRGAIITSEIEMLMKLCPGKIIGITGSDGKTTTTTLIHHILEKEGYHCFLGGNIGIPLFTKIEEMRPEDIVVLELSSFQLMNMKVSPDIAIVTNISQNHLDIHKSYEEYIDAKKNIFRYQGENSILILNSDNTITKEFAKEAKGKVIFFSSTQKLDDGIIYDNGMIKVCEDGLRKHIVSEKDIALQGKHNYENICAAIAATKELTSTNSQLDIIKTFSGVAHRIELVRELNGVKWYNDSASSTPTRTIVGVNTFHVPVTLIAGGYDKNLDYTPLAKPIIEHVSSLILIGNTASKIKAAVEEEAKKQNKQISIYQCDSLKQTVELARKLTKSGEVVLFSPASASFDMFKNAYDRGDQFKSLVKTIE